MKRIAYLFYSLILSVAVTSCKQLSLYQSLKNVDSLLDTSPDSCLQMISSIDPSSIHTKRLKANYSLMKAKVLDKNYIDVTNDSIINPALAYFKKNGPRTKYMESLYYKGMTYTYSNRDIDAIPYLERASEIAEELNKWHYAGLAKRELAILYDKSYDYYEAARLMEESVELFECQGELNYADWSRLMLAKVLINIKEHEKADSVISILLFPGNPLYHKATLVKAELEAFRNHPDTALALDFFREAFSGLDTPVSIHDINAYAYVLDMAGRKNDAQSILSVADTMAKTKADKAKVFYTKYKISKKDNDILSALFFLEKSIQIQDSLTYNALRQSLSYEREQYYEQEALEKTSRLRMAMYDIIILVLTLIIVLLFSFVSIHRRNAKYQELVNTLSDLNSRLAKSINNSNEQSAVVTSLIRQRILTITLIVEKYESLRNDKSTKESFFDHYEYLKTEVKDIRKSIEELKSDAVFIEGLEEALNVAHDGIMRLFRSYYPNKNDLKDLPLLMFLFAGLPNKETSFITGLNASTVRSKKRRWRLRFESIDNCKDREAFLSMLK